MSYIVLIGRLSAENFPYTPIQHAKMSKQPSLTYLLSGCGLEAGAVKSLQLDLLKNIVFSPHIYMWDSKMSKRTNPLLPQSLTHACVIYAYYLIRSLHSME
jgi:hypothetical protein